MKIEIKNLPLPKDSEEEKKLRLEKDLKLIIKSCFDEFDNIKSIILYGGYGRGEGSWIQSNGEWFPYNDYDIVVVVAKKIPKKRIQLLRKELAKKININWIDLSQKSPLRLLLMQKSIYTYDLKKASTVIWGDEKVKNLIPSISRSKLPSYEIVTLFFTRLWPFIGGVHRSSFKSGLQGEASRFFRNQMAKAVLATVDVQLLMKNAYMPSYIKRVHASLNYFKSSEVKIVKWALKEKLEPEQKRMSGEEVIEMYDSVHLLYSKVMLKGLSFHFGKDIQDYACIKKQYSKSHNLSILRLLHLIKGTISTYDKETKINLCQAYLFFSYVGNNDFDYKILDHAIKEINELPSSKLVHDWYAAADHVSQMRNNI